jgi:glycopeptide antibiotics resistance protein
MGWFARKLFRWGLFRTVIVGVGFTLLAEWAQLNAVFGLLPCNYRTFDVDDIALNAIGLVLGWLIALI